MSQPIHPAPNAPIGTRVRELRTGAVGTIVGASSAALHVRLETGESADGGAYGIHPGELELLSAEQYLSARYSAAAAPQRPELREGVRVSVHASADLWMRGVRFGTVYGTPYRRGGVELIGITADSGQRFAARVADLEPVR